MAGSMVGLISYLDATVRGAGTVLFYCIILFLFYSLDLGVTWFQNGSGWFSPHNRKCKEIGRGVNDLIKSLMGGHIN